LPTILGKEILMGDSRLNIDYILIKARRKKSNTTAIKRVLE
jgi:hypothetical protein